MKRRRANTSAKCKWSCIHDSMSILWSFVCAELDAVCLFICDVIRLLEHFVVCVWPCALLRRVCLGFLLLCAEAKVCACLFVRLCGCVSEFTCCGMLVIDRSCHAVIWEFREKLKHLFCQKLCTSHTHTMKWNKHCNIIFKSDFQPSLTVSIKHVWSLMFDTNTLSSCSPLTLRLMVSLSPQGTNYPLQHTPKQLKDFHLLPMAPPFLALLLCVSVYLYFMSHTM